MWGALLPPRTTVWGALRSQGEGFPGRREVHVLRSFLWHTYAHACLHTCVHMHEQFIYLRMCTHTPILALLHNTCAHTIHVVHACVLTCAHMYICTHSHTYIRAHPHAPHGGVSFPRRDGSPHASQCCLWPPPSATLSMPTLFK